MRAVLSSADRGLRGGGGGLFSRRWRWQRHPAIWRRAAHLGFFMNWTGAQKGEGIEYHPLVLAMTALMMIRGAGAFSIDRAMTTGGQA